VPAPLLDQRCPRPRHRLAHQRHLQPPAPQRRAAAAASTTWLYARP
jgi:hypothetical protein